MKESGNASVVPAAKLIRSARGVVAPVRRLVGSVGAVDATVANPRLYDAMTVIVAFELGGTALRHSGGFRTTLWWNS